MNDTYTVFDGWSYGSTITDMKRDAARRRLPMSPGVSSYTDKYDAKRLNGKPNERRFRYKTTLFDKRTMVTLFYTKTSKQLYKINVKFQLGQLKAEERKYFYDSLFSKLNDKYGQAKHMDSEMVRSQDTVFSYLVSKHIMQGMFGSLWAWEVEDNLITLNYKKRYDLLQTYELNYVSNDLSAKNDREISADIRRRTNSALSKDEGRL